MIDEVDGMLADWLPCLTEYGGNFIVGVITGDRKRRFSDGPLMTTSLIVSAPEMFAEGALVETLNSRYRLRRRATEVSLQAFLYASSLRGVVIGPDGRPVEQIETTLSTDEGDERMTLDAEAMAGVSITFN